MCIRDSIDIIGHLARQAFYDVVSDDPVKKAMDDAVPGKYVAPETGNWDPAEVLTAKYFMC